MRHAVEQGAVQLLRLRENFGLPHGLDEMLLLQHQRQLQGEGLDCLAGDEIHPRPVRHVQAQHAHHGGGGLQRKPGGFGLRQRIREPAGRLLVAVTPGNHTPLLDGGFEGARRMRGRGQ